MAIACAVVLLLQAQDFPARVAEQVAKLKSDDPKVRTAATDELVRMGRRAIPALEATKSDDPEARSRIAQAISRIYVTDPFFLVRPYERRVSYSCRDLPFSEAHIGAFSGFPVPVTPSAMMLFEARPISLTVEQAGYWELVERFGASAKVRLDVFGESLRYETGSPSRRDHQWSRHGRFMVAVRVISGMIEVRLYPEPGLRPVTASFKVNGVTDGDGVSIQKSIVIETPAKETPSFGEWVARLSVPKDGAAVVNIDGTVTIELPMDTEAVELRDANETRLLSECPFTATDFKREAEFFDITLKSEGLKGWKAADPRLSRAWALVADDEGRSTVFLTFRFGDSLSSVGVRRGWDYPRRATRICIVRPTGVERVEIPVRFRGILLRD